MNRLLCCLPVSFLVACALSQGPVPVSHQADGSLHLKCDGSLGPCIQKAEELCKNLGFVVVGGQSKRQVYGAEVSQVEVREAELDVRCANRLGDLPTVASSAPVAAPTPKVPAASAPMPAPSAPSTVVTKSATACTPGATQRCFGPGACAGGQACAADGSGFGACDCGPRPAP